MILKYQTPQLKAQAEGPGIEPMLLAVVAFANAYCFAMYGKVMFVTSVLRPADKGSVHAYGRGFDTDNDTMPVEHKKDVMVYVNKHFEYDPERPEKTVCDLHAIPGRGGDNWHMQVHDNTRWR